VDRRRDRLSAAHLYLVCDQRPDAFLQAALRGGVDVVQLRIKGGSDEETVAAARRFASVCAEHEALFILNDRPDLAAEVGADGVHVGQDDVSVAHARRILGPDRIVGLSTHSPAQVDAAARPEAAGKVDVAARPEVAAQVDAAVEADYIGVGPVHETPTKPGRPPVGLELVRYAARSPIAIPWFAIGGIDAANLRAVREAGARRIAVVRALTRSSDPELAARELRAAILGEAGQIRAPVGAAQ